MMNPRFVALETTGKRSIQQKNSTSVGKTSEEFGIHVFNQNVMQKILPREIYHNVINSINGIEKIDPKYADSIAVAMKEWAVGHGATHYTHLFQPLTGATAEKHDTFLDITEGAIEKFNGKQLIQGEPDASSFPSGGLRSTFEARGYTGWDPSSPVFIWKGGKGIILCIPSVFFSWTGDVLDTKIPLHRSDKKINDACMRLLSLTGIKANYVFSTVGLEQEYFVIDRALRDLRPDLLLAGHTVFGAPSPKGQELQDHYFGSVKDRILNYMCDYEEAAIRLGIPLKTRHNEVAPSQHEVAPVFEKASLAVDHNIMLMELMRKYAVKHNLACLLHEKPFRGLNGSGKHSNWSLSTDTGINLLDPTDTPENNLHFLILLTAILTAVHKHSILLRASIGSPGNDHRLGGHEAPPAIISIYLGDELESVLNNIEEKGVHQRSTKKGKYDLGITAILDLMKDNTDRNRTSPFAFTGNKFEFRALGSSLNPAIPTTVLNVIVAESLNKILDEIEKNLPNSSSKISDAIIPVIRKYLHKSKPIRFSGDNYSKEWIDEAKSRNLPNIKKSIYAFEAFKSKETLIAFEGVLTEAELESRYEILAENYAHTLNIDVNLMTYLFQTHILPAALKYQEKVSTSIRSTIDITGETSAFKEQKNLLSQITELIENGIKTCNEVKELQVELLKLPFSKMGIEYVEKLMPKCEVLRSYTDQLELLVDDELWPLPKYRELLFMV